MNIMEQNHFNQLYQKHLRELKLQGKSQKTIDAYSRAIRRVATYFDRCPHNLTSDELKLFFSDLVDSHSWSTVKLDRCGLQFFYKHVLDVQWKWIDIVKPPRIKHLPDILTIKEVQTVMNQFEKIRYKACLFAIYSMGLRLSEGVNLEVSSIDSNRHLVHVRDGKGGKDRFVPLPETTLQILRLYWTTHRNPVLLFPNVIPGLKVSRI